MSGRVGDRRAVGLAFGGLVGGLGLQGAPRWLPCSHPNPSKTQEDLEAQVTLVENLRRYVGEQVPPEVHSQMWESERQELLETVQVRECWAWGGT